MCNVLCLEISEALVYTKCDVDIGYFNTPSLYHNNLITYIYCTGM